MDIRKIPVPDLPTELAARVAGSSRHEFNQICSDGTIECSPGYIENGKRVLTEDDMVMLALYNFLRERTLARGEAGRIACEISAYLAKAKENGDELSQVDFLVKQGFSEGVPTFLRPDGTSYQIEPKTKQMGYITISANTFITRESIRVRYHNIFSKEKNNFL